ncbi:E3 ubiquitin-protein ligase [Parasponia andersonii]|uniref:E3 ubiquitin-protein ligase n=1 Tax=Parasponia andersonii TaxID=3476 RepID=A0A2P5E000_PARAD|nr:E3 ubiquitin-protein ligase [Parasponia andersonii]
MSQQRNPSSVTPKLNLSVQPPRQLRADSPEPDTHSSSSADSASSSSEMSIDGSCVSSEAEEECLSSEDSGTAAPMVLVGCPRCLMYVLLSHANPKCPKCRNTVLLDFINEETNKKITGA